MKRLRYAVETAILAVAVTLFFYSLAWLINEHYLRSLFAIICAYWIASAWPDTGLQTMSDAVKLTDRTYPELPSRAAPGVASGSLAWWASPASCRG